MELDAFLEIEHKYGLIRDRLNGFAYWTYFRRDLAGDIMKKLDSGGELYVYPKRSAWQQTLARLGTIKYAFLYGRIPKGKHDMLILNAERRVWSQDHYECIYTDRIASEYPDSAVMERPYFQKHYRPVKTGNLFYTDPIEIKTMAHWYSRQLFQRKQVAGIRDILRQKICMPVEEIGKAYQVKCDLEWILDSMVCGYYVYQTKRKELGKILDRLAPRIILEVVGYNIDCMIINELAAERRIPTVELQHGVTGAAHIAYNYYPDTKVEQFPQYFFAFSKFWIDTARYPLAPGNLREIGFPHLDEKAREVKRKVSKGFPRQILFISQPKIGEMLSDIAVDLNELIDAKQYKIVFKLHPGEYERWKERYPRLSASGIEVIDNSRVDLYELFAASVYQIGGYGSTATFEGLVFDLKTYIMREGAYPAVASLCEKGMAQFFDSAQDLYRLILSDSPETEQKNNFWKENALENMKREIDAIMNGGAEWRSNNSGCSR